MRRNRERRRKRSTFRSGRNFLMNYAKTGLIAELLRSPAKVTLFTRPHRFGKTLAMTMLKCFFKIGTDPSLFDGLASRRRRICANGAWGSIRWCFCR